MVCETLRIDKMTNKEMDIDERVANLFIKEKRSASEIEKILLREGLDSDTIDEISNRLKNLELERARNLILRGIVFIILGLFFYASLVYAIHNGGGNYGGGIDYIGLIAIVYGIYKIIKGYHKRLCLKRDV